MKNRAAAGRHCWCCLAEGRLRFQRTTTSSSTIERCARLRSNASPRRRARARSRWLMRVRARPAQARGIAAASLAAAALADAAAADLHALRAIFLDEMSSAWFCGSTPPARRRVHVPALCRETDEEITT